MKAKSKAYYQALFSLALAPILIMLFISTRKSINLDLNWFSVVVQYYWLPLISAGIGLLGLLFPALMVHLLSALQFVQHKIGRLLTFIILTIVFYLILTPIAWLSRIFSKKKVVSSSSTFIDRNHKYSKEDLEKTW